MTKKKADQKPDPVELVYSQVQTAGLDSQAQTEGLDSQAQTEGLDSQAQTVGLDADPAQLERSSSQKKDEDNADEEAALNPLILAAVQGQVVDTAGNHWAFAIVQFSLFVPSGQKPIDLTTGLVIPNPAPIVCNATGTFSTNLQTTASIVPASLWMMTVYPFNNQFAGQTLEPFAVTGTVDLSAFIAANLAPHVDAPLILPMSNSGAVGQSQLNGSCYYDVVTGTVFVRDPATGGYKALPIPANVAFTNTANTFTQPQTFANGGLAIGSVADGLSTNTPTIETDGANLYLNPGTNSALYLNWLAGTGGVVFGNSGAAQIGAIDRSGNATFAGTLHCDGDFRAGAGAVMQTTGTAIDMWGSVTCHAGLDVTGGTKNFRIPHPLKRGKDLVHSCLEGPEVAVYYRGEGETTDGWTEILLPDYFEALTLPSDRTVQITAIVEDDDDAAFGRLGAGRVTAGKFRVYSSEPTARFYWEVKGIRKDVERLIVEPDQREADEPAVH
jgi:hypothetical protein